MVLLFISLTAFAGEKIELKWRTFDAGFEEAKKNNKKIMLDVYTDWCGWCKRLDKDTYGNEKVIEYLNKEYIAIKLNAESNAKINYKDKSYTETSLAQYFGVTGYPAIIFFDSDAEAINLLPGYVNAERFLPIIKYIGEDHFKSMSWEEYQEKDKKSK